MGTHTVKDCYFVEVGSLWRSKLKPDRFLFVSKFLDLGEYAPIHLVRFCPLILEDGKISKSSMFLHVTNFYPNDGFFCYWMRVDKS